MSVARITEISSSWNESFEDAIKQRVVFLFFIYNRVTPLVFPTGNRLIRHSACAFDPLFGKHRD